MDVNRLMMPGGGVTPASGVRNSAPADARTDAELATLAGGGDRAAAGALIQRYHLPIRRFLLKLTGREDLADDLAQETFVRLLRHAHRYDARYPMRTWLLTIARRLSINRGRADGRAAMMDDWHWCASADPSPQERAAEAEERGLLRRQLDAAIARLTDAQREAILLFHQQGLSVQQAAEVMNLPVGTVKSHLHRARAAMRQMLEGDERDDDTGHTRAVE